MGEESKPNRSKYVEVQEIDARLKPFEQHLEMLKWVFGSFTVIVAIVLSLVGFFSCSYDAKIDRAIDDMRRDFDRLSENALLHPKLKILYEGKEINGRKITSTAAEPEIIFQVQNIGDRATQSVSAALYAEKELQQNQSWWQKSSSEDENFPYVYKFTHDKEIKVSPLEVYDITAFKPHGPLRGSVKCKLIVYYQAKETAKVEFYLSGN